MRCFLEERELISLKNVVKAFDDGDISLDEFHRKVQKFIG